MTKAQLSAAFQATVAVAQTIRELKQVPSGVLYAQLMDLIDLPKFNALIQILKDTGRVVEENYMLVWKDRNENKNRQFSCLSESGSESSLVSRSIC